MMNLHRSLGQFLLQWIFLFCLFQISFTPLTYPQIQRYDLYPTQVSTSSGELIHLTYVKNENLLLSTGCVVERKIKCKAYDESIREMRSKAAESWNITLEHNPGSSLCKKLNRSIIIAQDQNKNELSFCQFEDGSLISSGSLFSLYRAQRKSRP